MNKKGDQRYLRSAVIWTIISVIALMLLFVAQGPLYGKICGMVLVGFCLAGQWIRYIKSK